MMMMDSLHLWGITVIQDIQNIFKSHSDLMMFLSYIGDPRFAFTFYFPLSYFLHHSVGKRVMWVTVVSEWLNAIAKWLLHGERPYWWIHESGLYSQDKVPQLQQFSITCETGPGSPSGHVMITGAVWYILVSDFLFYKRIKSVLVRISCWSLYLTVMCSIGVSRLFIATHFPHQVVAGIVSGVLIGIIFNSISTTKLKFLHYAIVCFGLTVCTVAVYALVKFLGGDPMWSLVKASRWCAKKEWVHLDTTVFYSLLRDVSSLLGLGIGVSLQRSGFEKNSSMIVMCLHIVVALAMTTFSEGLKPARDNLLLYYALGFVKHTATVCCVVAAVPLVLCRLTRV